VVFPLAGELEPEGYAPTELIGLVVQPASGALTLTGHAPTNNNPNWVIIDTNQVPNWVPIVTG